MAGVLSIQSLPREYGYVLLVSTASVWVNGWLVRNVMKAREEYKVEYPNMYSDDSKEFNCIQRAHQNYLEMYPMFVSQLLISGTVFPRLASGLGVIYLAGKVAYAKGYYSGDPENRSRGRFYMFGYFGLMALTMLTAFRQLRPNGSGWGPMRRGPWQWIRSEASLE